ncbi:hypothetical protein FISHEDRAFT_56058 [Fistulina hepatica ATCC 64428]|uniref:Uncharacterized protein n=1 Tax=Fistulina hepatica ATCC 64428 TaxID=1128425 RepID=A0A0D7AKC5_9AGAR|nr:hypothetical protein FISHEDRAFT_56058 [Fistulina hepatica ATCC 64428]
MSAASPERTTATVALAAGAKRSISDVDTSSTGDTSHSGLPSPEKRARINLPIQDANADTLPALVAKDSADDAIVAVSETLPETAAAPIEDLEPPRISSAPDHEVIELLDSDDDDEEATETQHPVAPERQVEVIELLDSDDDDGDDEREAMQDEGSYQDDGASDSEDEDEENHHGVILPSEVQARLVYISENIEGLTSTFLRFIMDEISTYMGPRSGTNNMIAAAIVQHCTFRAAAGLTDLVREKRAVRDARAQCWGSCPGNDEEQHDPDLYNIPQEVTDRLNRCFSLMQGLPDAQLQKIRAGLLYYNGPVDGHLADEIIDFLDTLAADGKDIRKEEALIERVYAEHESGQVKKPPEVIPVSDEE